MVSMRTFTLAIALLAIAGKGAIADTSNPCSLLVSFWFWLLLFLFCFVVVVFVLFLASAPSLARLSRLWFSVCCELQRLARMRVRKTKTAGLAASVEVPTTQAPALCRRFAPPCLSKEKPATSTRKSANRKRVCACVCVRACVRVRGACVYVCVF